MGSSEYGGWPPEPDAPSVPEPPETAKMRMHLAEARRELDEARTVSAKLRDQLAEEQMKTVRHRERANAAEVLLGRVVIATGVVGGYEAAVAWVEDRMKPTPPIAAEPKQVSSTADEQALLRELTDLLDVEHPDQLVDAVRGLQARHAEAVEKLVDAYMPVNSVSSVNAGPSWEQHQRAEIVRMLVTAGMRLPLIPGEAERLLGYIRDGRS